MLMMEDVDLGLNITATLNFTIVEKVLMVIVEVDIGILPATLPPITHMTMFNCCVYLMLLVVFSNLLMSMK